MVLWSFLCLQKQVDLKKKKKRSIFKALQGCKLHHFCREPVLLLNQIYGWKRGSIEHDQESGFQSWAAWV